MPIISEKQNNQKQVLTLNELEKRKVVEHNSLITSIAKMDKTPLKMFELAVSCIDTEKPLEDNTVYLSKKTFSLSLRCLIMTNTVVLKKRLRKCRNKPFQNQRKKR